MNQGYLCKSDSKSKIHMSRLTASRNSLQCQIPAMKSRRSSSADSRPRSSGGGISKPRCMSEERKSVFNNNRRKSSININECKVLKEQRPLSDRGYQKKKIMELIDFLNETSFKHQITPTKLMQPSKKDFENIFEHLASFFEPDYVVKRIEEEAPRILKSLCYSFIPVKSAFVYVARINWPTLLGVLLYMMDLAKFAFEVDQKTFFQSVECENPQEFTILLNYIFNAYRSGADDEEKEFAVFKSIIKKRFPCDFEDLEEKNAQLNLALEQYEKEVNEINKLKTELSVNESILKQYEEFLNKMKNYRKKKEEGSQKLIEELAEKEAELKSFQNILAQRQAVYDAQGFDGKKQMHYFENQKMELLERMQTKKANVKKLTDECHDAEIHYSRTLDAGSSVCETFNELYSKVNDMAVNTRDTLKDVNDQGIKDLFSNLNFDYPECRMQLAQKSILQRSDVRKNTLSEIKQKIDSICLIFNCRISNINEKLHQVLMQKSDISVKIKVASSEEIKKERALSAEEKLALEEIKNLQDQIEEILKALESMRVNATDCENTKSMLEKEYEDIHEMRKGKQRMLNEYLVIQKKLFSQRANKLENMRKEVEKSGEEIYLVLSEKLRKM